MLNWVGSWFSSKCIFKLPNFIGLIGIMTIDEVLSKPKKVALNMVKFRIRNYEQGLLTNVEQSFRSSLIIIHINFWKDFPFYKRYF